MSQIVRVYDKDCSIVSINQIENEAAFILKELKEDKYHIIYERSLDMLNSYRDLQRRRHLLNNPVESLTNKDFYYIDESLKFKVYAKMPNKWLVKVFNKKDQLEYGFEHKDFKKVNEGNYILKNYKKYPEKYKYKVRYLNFKDIEDWYYKSDEIVAECISELFDCTYYYDLHGTLRIKNKELPNQKEKIFISDLNEGFRKYYEGKYTFTELIIIYTKLNYSFNGFMEIFNSSLISDDFDTMTIEEVKEDVIKILNSEKESYDK